MAWRDSRGSRRWIGLFLSAMVVGIAAVVAIQGFGANMRAAMDEQARLLLGADLSIEAGEAFSSKQEALIDSLGGEQARRITFSSMAYFPSADGTRLVSVRAAESAYPLYGRIITNPVDAASSFADKGEALVDISLMQRFDLEPGDSVRIGQLSYSIGGGLERTMQESSFFAAISPRIFLPYTKVDSSLLSRGSRAEYEVFFRFDESPASAHLGDSLFTRIETLGLDYDTPQEVQQDWVRGLGSLSEFLSLVAFIALLLGGIGVASAVHVYVKRRVDTVVVLRCLGASSAQTLGIYTLQAAATGLICAFGGIALGVGLQALLPALLADFVPVDVPFHLAISPMLAGLVMGFGLTLLFALLPLVSVRRVAPLKALRSAYEGPGARRDPLWWLLMALLVAGITAAATIQASTPVVGMAYAAGVGAVCALLVIVGALLRYLIKVLFPSSWAYVWRQGLANLYRPQNQTLLLTLTIGFAAFLLFTLFLVQHALLDQFSIAEAQSEANTVLFDVQPRQLEEVQALIREQGFPVIETVPLVAMRIESVRGVPVDSLLSDSTVDDRWVFTRQYRSTYRSSLSDTETLTEGRWVDSVSSEGEVVPVSVEEDISTDLGVAIGDSITFGVQGIAVTSVVGSLRTVDWRQMSTNFFFVFPEGVLEDAPQTYVVLTATASDRAAAGLQSALVQSFPGILLLDLSLIIEVLEGILAQASFVIRFMALFSLIVGLLVLVGSVVVSRVQRVRETVLLKTLGASGRQIYSIAAVEYLLTGLTAALAGALLAVAATWALVAFLFEGEFVFLPWRVIAGIALVVILTITIGLMGSRGVYRRTAMEVLREV